MSQKWLLDVKCIFRMRFIEQWLEKLKYFVVFHHHPLRCRTAIVVTESARV